MAQRPSTMQSTDNGSVLLALYQELRESNNHAGKRHEIQARIDQIISQNLLHYVNR